MRNQKNVHGALKCEQEFSGLTGVGEVEEQAGKRTSLSTKGEWTWIMASDCGLACVPGKTGSVWEAVMEPGEETGKTGGGCGPESLEWQAEELDVYCVGTSASYLRLQRKLPEIGWLKTIEISSHTGLKTRNVKSSRALFSPETLGENPSLLLAFDGPRHFWARSAQIPVSASTFPWTLPSCVSLHCVSYKC